MPTRNQKSCWFGLAGSVPSHLERLCVVCDTIPNSTKRSYIENCSINRGVAIVTWASCLWCRRRWQWNSGECMQMFMLLMILVILKPTAKENKEKTQENGGNNDESPRELHAQWGLNGTKRELSQATLIDKLKLKTLFNFHYPRDVVFTRQPSWCFQNSKNPAQIMTSFCQCHQQRMVKEIKESNRPCLRNPKKWLQDLGLELCLWPLAALQEGILLKILQDMWDLRPEAWRQLYTKNSEWDIPFWGRFTPLTIIMVVQNRPVPLELGFFVGMHECGVVYLSMEKGKKVKRGRRRRGGGGDVRWANIIRS